MLRLGVTREWVDKGELPKKQTQSKRESVRHERGREVETTEANSKYQDKAKGQKPRSFTRPVSTVFSSR
ncbi:hypothetical protein BHM03_00014389 [Ensete ventricosum]|nr:hypothetical protein BHM03_00014389 [Ensete ventricosum]